MSIASLCLFWIVFFICLFAESEVIFIFKVFNQRLAGYLMLKGFKLLSVEPNRDIKDFNIFTFEKSDKLNRTIKQYEKIKDFLI